MISPPLLTLSSPQSETRRSGDIAAKQLSISRQKGEHVALGVTVMDKLEKAGKKTEAHQVRQLLKKNAGKAYRIAKELTPLVIPPEEKKEAKSHEQPKYVILDYWQTLKEEEQRHILFCLRRPMDTLCGSSHSLFFSA